MSIDGIINEPTVNFVGKDGFYWWVGEVEDNKDPMELGRCKVRVLGYYTNVRGGTTADLPTDDLPWATVLQTTAQAGNDGQGESSGQLQPGAIVMGFFMDGENAQMPIVIGVLRVNKSSASQSANVFAFTGENMEVGSNGHVNPVLYHPADPSFNVVNPKGSGGNKERGSDNNSVPMAGTKTTTSVAGPASPGKSLGDSIPASGSNTKKPLAPSKPIPAANGVGGPWKTLEYQLSYLVEDLANTAGTLVKAENGDFLDIVEGKIITAKALTAKLQNFLGAVFAQVVAAIKQQFSTLAEELEIINLLGKIGKGVPFALTVAIQTAVTTILKALCMVDNQLLGLIQDPIGAVLGVLEGFLDGLIDKAAMVVQGVQEVIDSVVCGVQGILNQMLTVVDTVKTIVEGFEQAQEIIEVWQAGSEIFGNISGITKSIQSISGLIALFFQFVAGDCGRTADGGKDTVGWFPLYGVTHCTPEELAEINEILGLNKNKASCGDPFGTGTLIDNIIKEADPYLTSAKTFLDGAYELHVGTPGRQATVKKTADGTVETSIKTNNSEYAEHKARQAVEEQTKGSDISEEEKEKKVQEFKKKESGGKGDTGALVAKDIQYAGNFTQRVRGDDCKVIDNDYVRNVNGDYFLKVTGNCHIEVGGGFFLSAEGGPRLVDKNGENNSSGQKIQKHTVRFGSDLDLSIPGSKLHMEAAELETAANKHLITGALYTNNSSQQSYAAGTIHMAGESEIEIATPHLLQLINQNIFDIPPVKAGITTFCNGSIITTMNPSLLDPVPTHSIINSLGSVNRVIGGGGYTCSIGAGNYYCNIATGNYVTNVLLGNWTTSVPVGNIALTCVLGVMKLTALTIYLN